LPLSELASKHKVPKSLIKDRKRPWHYWHLSWSAALSI
jgi:hypothetical protein